MKTFYYGSDASATHLVFSLWYLDLSQELKDNNCYTTRLKYVGNSQTVELYGRLYADLFNSDKMLINGVDMSIKLTRTPEAFYLLAPTDDTKVRIKILDATLLIPQVELKPPLLLAHANVLLVNMFLPARYTCNDKRAVQMFRAQFGQ